MGPRVPHPTNINWVKRPSMPRVPRHNKRRAPRRIVPAPFRPPREPLIVGTWHGWQLLGIMAVMVAALLIVTGEPFDWLTASVAAGTVATVAVMLVKWSGWRPFGERHTEE